MVTPEHWGAALAGVGFALHASAELGAPAWTLILAQVAAVVSGLISRRGLPLSKPLCGGLVFVTLQAHGWLMLGVGAGLCVLFVAGRASHASLPRGTILVGLGLGSVAADTILLLSRRVLDRPRKSGGRGFGRVRFSADVLRPWTVILPSALATLASLVLFVMAEFASSPRLLVGPAMLVTLLGAALTHVGVGCRRVAGFKMVQPFEGGAAFCLLQAEGWVLVAVTVNIALACLLELSTDDNWASSNTNALFPGLLCFAGVVSVSGNVCLLWSIPLFDKSPVQSAAPTSGNNSNPTTAKAVLAKALWGTAVALLAVPAVVLVVAHAANASVQHQLVNQGITPARLVLCMLLSGPLSHFSGAVAHSNYNLFQPLLGGFRFVTFQVLGWFLYGSATAGVVIMALNQQPYLQRQTTATVHLLPTVFAAQVCLSLSVRVFLPTATPATPEAENEAAERATTQLSTMWSTAALAVVLVLLTFVGHCSGPSLGLEGAKPEQLLGWGAAAALVVVTASGFHLVYTHFWLLLTAAVMVARSDSALAAMAVLGFNVSVTWYSSLMLRAELQCPQRAMSGWSRWICEELIGLRTWQGRVSWRPINSLLTGFHLTDLGVHLLPTLILLQLAAEHITFASVMHAYVITRLWSLLVTAQHIQVEWASSRRTGWRTLVLRREQQSLSGYVDEGVINKIYGFEPSAPPQFFHFAACVELAATVLCAAITLAPITAEQRAEVFRVLGGRPLASATVLSSFACLMIVLGVVVIAAGAVLGFATGDTVDMSPKLAEVKERSGQPVRKAKRA